MATFDDLTAAVQQLTSDETTLAANDAALKTAVDQMLAFVATLQPGQLTADQQAKLDSATAAVQAAATGTAQAGTDTAADAASLNAVDAPASPPPALPLYQHANANPFDTTVWTLATEKDTNGGPLYHFSGDTAGQPPTGASADWVVYTGPTT